MIVSGPAHRDIAALTDAEGRFQLTALPSGEYGVSAYAQGYAPQTRRVEVRADGVAGLTIRVGA
jgi:hypothetical protein